MGRGILRVVRRSDQRAPAGLFDGPSFPSSNPGTGPNPSAVTAVGSIAVTGRQNRNWYFEFMTDICASAAMTFIIAASRAESSTLSARVLDDVASEAVCTADHVRRPESCNRRLFRRACAPRNPSVRLDFVELIDPLLAREGRRLSRLKLSGFLQYEWLHRADPRGLRRANGGVSRQIPAQAARFRTSSSRQPASTGRPPFSGR